jgi:hypothetical protein
MVQMNQVVINRITPIGTAVAEMLYMMFQHGDALRGTVTITQHAEESIRLTRFKLCLEPTIAQGGKHYGCRNAWLCETDDAKFRLYLTDFEETVELFKTHESFEAGLERIAGYSYGLQEIYQACVDVQAFMRDGELPIRGADQTPKFHARIAA